MNLSPPAVLCFHCHPCEPQVKCSFKGTTKNNNSQISRLSLHPSLKLTPHLFLSASQLIRGALSGTASLSPASPANQDSRWRLCITRALSDWRRGPGSAGQ